MRRGIRTARGARGRGIRRLLAVVVIAATALVAGHVVVPAHSALTDARFTDSEVAGAAFKTTSMPTITFSDPSSNNAPSFTFSWKYNGTALPGQTVTFTANATGLVLLGTYSVTSTENSRTGGLNTVTLTAGGLPTGTGTYEVHATTSVGGWTSAAMNHVSLAVTCVLVCGYGSPSYPAGG
ncbi:hypothetical protein GCM10022286_21870 [Gryllotalpicola daejeonensis]|uniref:PKD domain-containing protein n=1 Tax=Gryllotalpicola daejeonensis TaxID=993087 RepID=A0ABP7ZL87_9MICO